jgi:hypothetical protein
MSGTPTATYTFLPFLRQGLANSIKESDDPGRTGPRGTTDVVLRITAEKVAETVPDPDGNITKSVRLYGPGDVVGIDPRAIVKNEPRHWVTNFEANYLPYVEFYDEDFPWRYTPARQDAGKHRLRPWLTLVVLKESEFKDGGAIKDKPLPFVTVADAATSFPRADQLWAWAHVHVNRSLFESGDQTTSTDLAAVLANLGEVLRENPDLAYSRILCPRRLEPDTPYHALVVPTFESGRLAGLGLDPEKSPRTMLAAWEAYPAGAPDPKPEPDRYPYYHRWFFRTGTVGDFEYLVRLLTPKPADSRLGNRDMDLQDPGSNVPGLESPLKLGGALMAPFAPQQNATGTAFTKEVWEGYEHWAAPFPHELQGAVADLINLAAEYQEKSAAAAHDAVQSEAVRQHLEQFREGEDPDPVVTPPLYGCWHAQQFRLLRDADGSPLPNLDRWTHQLNLDPRYRVPGGFGTRVVQEKQEELMDSAWGQLGRVLEANRKIRHTQVAKEVSAVWYLRHLEPLLQANQERALLVMTPVQRRVLVNQATVYHTLSTSAVPYAVTSAPMRRIVRPRARLLRSLDFTNGPAQPANLLSRINAGEVNPAPPKVAPTGAVTDDQVAKAAGPRNAPPGLVAWLKDHAWLARVPAVLALVLLVAMILLGASGAWIGTGIAVVGGALYLTRLLRSWSGQARAADLLRGEQQTPQAVDTLPASSDFHITSPGSAFRPRTGGTDGPEARRFKTALKDLFSAQVAGTTVSREPVRTRLDLPGLVRATFDAIDPEVTLPRRLWHGIVLPARLAKQPVQNLKEIMAYPEFDLPMYKPLADLSSELFLPNVQRIEPNSITLLQTNQNFIEAYMVGLNHEFARELLWREYPTDQRGSYFRQFWDVSGCFKPNVTDREALREQLRDIPPIHLWPKGSALGDHDHRETDRVNEEEVVLVIRGELLKKYPTAVIYAHRAEWGRASDNRIDNTVPRSLTQLTAAEEAEPPLDKVKTPLYEAKLEPDIYFFGFDLTVEEASGKSGDTEGDPAGWFFVIKERPGEPRFGLDIDKAAELNIWNDLSWPDIEVADGHIQLQGGKNPAVALTPISPAPPAPGPGQEKGEARLRWEQQQEDLSVHWNTADQSNAAELADILYQVPVMVAVHAKEMLPAPPEPVPDGA